MKIPFFDYPKHYLEKRKKYLDSLDFVLSGGRFVMQKELEEFEEKLANYCECKYAVGVADGTAALKLCLQINDIGYGDEVIISNHTFIATSSAINSVGAIPVACDIGFDGLIDTTKIEELITNKTKAIMPTQLNGLCSDMNSIKLLCEKYKLKIIEDSCQGMGVFYEGIHAGLFGIAGSLSFFPAKTLGCFGDGGAVLTNNKWISEKIKKLRNHGRDDEGLVNEWGINGRLDNIQSIVLNIKLQNIEHAIAKRRKLANLYTRNLDSLIPKYVSLPFFSHTKSYSPTFQNYEILVESRNELKSFLSENDIGTLIQWGGKMIHHHNLNIRNNASYSNQYSEKMIMLPLNHYLAEEHVNHICDKIKSFYGM